MSLVPSLLRAIVTIDGDALVLHVGDKPYVLSASGQIDLAPRGLTYDAIAGVIAQLLPEESQKALQEYGAAQHELNDLEDFPGEQFSVVAARGGDDVWVEIRRRRQVSPAQTPQEPAEDIASDERHDETPTVPHDAAPRVVAAPRPVEFPGVSALWSEASALSESAPGEPSRSTGDEPDYRSRVVEPERIEERVEERPVESSQPAVVLQLTKNPLRSDPPPPLAGQALSGLDRLLRLAAARGASTLYLSSGARPSIRVDGELQALESTPLLGPNDVESLLLTLMPERSAEALRTGSTSEWICDFPDLGRVRCMSFRDHRGPGGVFRIMPTRAVTSQQLGLSREIQELAG